MKPNGEKHNVSVLQQLAQPLRDRMISGVRRGRYSLLLGAGFSCAAQSADGRYLPTSGKLARELAEHFHQPVGHPLQRLWPALPESEREEYLDRRFRHCIVDRAVLPLPSFLWDTIYTLNVDDVVETLYSYASQQQTLATFTLRDQLRDRESIGEVQCIHLHGYVGRPDDGYVFSTAQYAHATIRHTAWPEKLADVLVTSPVLVLGCGLDEFDLELHLARRGELNPLDLPIPSVLVLPNPDSILEATARRFGMVLVNATAAQFLQDLEASSAPRPSIADLVLPKDASDLYGSFPTPRDQRVFHRQFVLVQEDELPESSDHLNFLRGREPQWEDFLERNDVIRADVSRAIDWAQDAGEHVAPQVLLLRGFPGCGKSALLMRIALELSRSGTAVFYFSGSERLSSIATAECLSRIVRPTVLIVDVIGDHLDQVMLLVDRCLGSTIPLVIVGADREKGIRDALERLPRNNRSVWDVAPLTSVEARQLVAKLRHEGLLGIRAGDSDETLSRRMEKTDLLVALCESCSNVGRFDALVESLYLKQSERWEKRALVAVALAHSHGYPLKMAIIQKVSDAPIRDLLRSLGSGSLQDVLVREGYGNEYVRLAHRVLAERIVEELLDSDVLLELYIRVGLAIAPYVSRETIKRRTPEARLARLLFDYKPHVHARLGSAAREFYEGVKAAWEWNSRYWEQTALLELDAGDFRAAVAHAEQAVGIEPHPLTFTTLGTIHMRIAVNVGDEGEAAGHFREAIAALREAIQRRQRLGMIDAHSHHQAIVGSSRYYEHWRIPVARSTDDWIAELFFEARRSFSRSFDWDALEARWSSLERNKLPT